MIGRLFVIRVLTFTIFIVSLFFVFKVLLLQGYPDFNNHYFAPKLVLKGLNPYVVQDHFFTQYVYPPFNLVFFLPFGYLPFFVAQKVWILLSFAFFIASIVLIFRTIKEKWFSYFGIISTSLFIIFYFPLKFSLGMGQINLLILFLISLSIYFFYEKKDILSGFFLAFSFVMKFFPILFIPYFLLLKKWRLLISFTISTAVLNIISLVILKPEINIHFWKNIFFDLVKSSKDYYYNQSLDGVILRLFGQNDLSLIIVLVITFILLLVSFIVISKNIYDKKYITDIHLSTLITLSLMINKFSWQHHFVWLVIPVFFTLFYILKNKLPNKYLYVLFFGFFLTSINFSSPETVSLIFQSHVFFGAMIIWALDVYLLLCKS